MGTYYYFLPTYSQAKKVIWNGIDKQGMKFLDHFPAELVTKKNESEMKIEIRNGSVFQVVGADNIDSIVGTNPIGVVLSEYPLMKPQVWEYLRPILAENGGFAIFVYTPRGKNEGWKILQIAKENDKEWWHQVLTVDDTQAISKEALEQEKAEMPSDLFEQEYYVKFIDGASSVFRKIDDNLHSEEIKSVPGNRYQIGIDLAKYQDFTVLTAIDLHTFKIAKQERFNKLDWNTQKEQIIKFIRYWNNGIVYMDTTGLGDPIYDDLTAQKVPIESFKFTESSREQLLNGLKILIEQNKIKLPNDPILLDELKSFQYELVGSKVKMRVPEGIHDDTVMSLALAVWGLSEPIPLQQSKPIIMPKLATFR